MTSRTTIGRRRSVIAVGTAVFLFTLAATAEAAPPLATTRISEPDAEMWTYRVEQGDTLIGISRRFLVRPNDWPALQRINTIGNPRHLQPGSAVRIPLAWMQQSPMAAEVVFVRGPATLVESAPGAPGARAGTDTAARALVPGDSLHANDLVRTGAGASVTLRIPDGSRLLVAPGTEMRVDRLLRLGREGVPASRFGLDRGDAEIRVTPSRADRSFEIQTPAVNLGVRGTRFRAHADAPDVSASSATATARVEVLEGRVAAEAGADQVLVGAGQGAVAVPGQPLAAPRTLLGAPDLVGTGRRRIERLPLVFAWEALSGARTYRAQVFARDAPDQLLLDDLFEQPSAKWADLPDGEYELVVRGLDGQRLEGLDARTSFQLKARPEPPFTLKPAAGANSWGEHADFAWARVSAARRYRLQVASTEDFAQPAVDDATLLDPRAVVGLAPGAWYWRVASIAATADGADDPGPWGDAQAFVQRPVPPVPAIEPPSTDARGVHLRWKAPGAGEQVRVQIATDAAFAAVVLDQTTIDDGTVLPSPLPGTYFVRARTIAADGFEGAFGAAQQIEVPRPRGFWWLLLPVLAGLLAG